MRTRTKELNIANLNAPTEEHRRRLEFISKENIPEMEGFVRYLADFGLKHLGGTEYTLADHDSSLRLSRRQTADLIKRAEQTLTQAVTAFAQDFIDGKIGPRM